MGDSVASLVAAGVCVHVPSTYSDMTTLSPAVSVLLDEADRFFSEGALESARTCLQQAAQLNPQSAEIHLAIGFTWFQGRHLQMARASFERAVRLDPMHAAAHANLAIVLRGLGDLDAAEAAAMTALTLRPGNVELLQMLAAVYMERSRFLPAAQLYYSLLQHRPEDPEVLLPLGICFYRAGDIPTAREIFEWILRIDPNHIIARENLDVALGAPLSVQAA
jgi:tetratricopeptide (TPR) repeat protein